MPYVVIEQDETVLQEGLLPLPRQITQLYRIAQAGAIESNHLFQDFEGLKGVLRLNCLSVLPLPILVERIGLYYQNHLGFHLRFSGELNGELYVFLRAEHALAVLQKQPDPKMNSQRQSGGLALDRSDIAALAEMANIIANPFGRALAEQTVYNWWITPPLYVADLSRSVSYSAKVYNLAHEAIHIEYLMPIPDVRCQLILLTVTDTLQKILSGSARPENYESEPAI